MYRKLNIIIYNIIIDIYISISKNVFLKILSIFEPFLDGFTLNALFGVFVSLQHCVYNTLLLRVAAAQAFSWLRSIPLQSTRHIRPLMDIQVAFNF